MAMYQNKSAGPRVFALKGGGRRTLLPGQAAEMEFARGPDEDRVLKAWMDSGELVETSEKQVANEAKAEAEDLNKMSAEVLEVQGKLLAAVEKQRALEMDQERRSVPRQFGGDGGPEQVGTVDGQGGALTPQQEEKGRAEMPAQQQATLADKRRAEDETKAQEAEKAKAAAALAAKAAPRGR